MSTIEEALAGRKKSFHGPCLVKTWPMVTGQRATHHTIFTISYLRPVSTMVGLETLGFLSHCCLLFNQQEYLILCLFRSLEQL